jgi:WXG100 family type VII secretion target
MEGTLLVTPEELLNASSAFSANMSSVQSITTAMMEIVTQTSGYWEGEAREAYVNKFNQLQDDIEKIHKMIQEHVTDLEAMAKTYQQAEQKSMETANQLSGDVL